MTSTLLITIPTTRILQDHAEYGVSCALNAAAAGGGTVVVWRRYKDFEHLRSALIRASPTLPVPNLPPKHSWWTSRSAQIVNERQRQLEAFLREVEAGIERPSQAWNVFCHFINVSPSISTSLVPVSRRESEDVTNVLREEVLRLQNQLSLLEDEENKLKLDLAAKDAELNNLRGRRIDAKQIKEQTVQLEKEKNHLLVEVARLEALLNSTGEQQAELNLLKEENTRLANDISILEGERNDLKTALERHEELVGSLRREISRLEDESKKMQDEIARLQHNLESNPAQENLRAEVNRLRKEKGELELEIARLETAQQSAASYGASVLAKLEKVEKEKAEQQAQAKATIEAEAKITNQLRERIEQLQKELKAAKENLALASRDIDIANNHTQEVMAANQLLKTSLDGEESELQTLRNELQSTRDKLATVYAEYEILKAKSLSGEDEIGSKLEYLAKQATEYKTESEKNANIKVKLAARVDTLVAENLHLKEKNLSLERRLKLLQGD